MKILIFLIVFSSLAIAKTDTDLLRIAKEGFKARAEAGGLIHKKEAVLAFRRPFENLTDKQKIRALTLFLYDIDEHDSKWSMSASITMGVSYALKDDPDFIRDWSSLRKLLKKERDPRRFYLLSNLTPWVKGENSPDFIAEKIHMLFADGRVAKEEGEYTREYAHDVSLYTYTVITGKLRALGADFEPPPKNLPHEEQAVILAKWLKENWPGCEKIQIPRYLSSGKTKQRKALAKKEKPSTIRMKKREQEKSQETRADNDKKSIPLLVAGVLLLGILAFFFKTFNATSNINTK